VLQEVFMYQQIEIFSIVLQEVFRIRAEHPDDNQAVFNDRVKGQLKVTRAFVALVNLTYLKISFLATQQS